MTLVNLTPTQHPVLIIEDDAFMAQLLSFVLKRQGLQVRCVPDGDAALRLLEGRCDYSAVLLDLLLPRHSGLDVLSRMRQLPDWSLVPVLVLSALDKAEDIARAFEAGADDFVTKPFNPDELLARLKARTNGFPQRGQP